MAAAYSAFHPASRSAAARDLAFDGGDIFRISSGVTLQPRHLILHLMAATYSALHLKSRSAATPDFTA